MNFENSLHEERYNDYWNQSVVALDKKIRSASLNLCLFDNTNISKLIKEYHQHVQNILSNLDRQSYMFDDKEYVQQYLKNTIEQAVDDLNFYATIVPKHKDIAKELIETLSLKEETIDKQYNAPF